MKQLIEAYRQKKLILFVGAGVSANLGLPSWSELIDEIAKQLGYDPDVFKTYGDHLSLAEYHRIQKKDHIQPLLNWMDTEWHSATIKIEKSEIHKIIVEGDFDLIYTTNYDRWIENAHDYYSKEYIKIVTVTDLTKVVDGKRQIVKLHGDSSSDYPIVLDESSYFERLDFENPLDIKLRSDILGKSVLFIGYSLSDINIRLLFYKLSKLWNKYGNNLGRPKSYIFSPRHNPIQKAIFEKRGVKMFNSNIDKPEKALISFLKKVVSNR
jgi:hypothetical protein